MTELTAESASLSIASQRCCARTGPILMIKMASGTRTTRESQRIIHGESDRRELTPAFSCGRERGAHAAAPAADAAGAAALAIPTGAFPCAVTMNVAPHCGHLAFF